MPGGPLLLPFLLGYIKYSLKEQKKKKETKFKEIMQTNERLRHSQQVLLSY
jgi:hypothetical protein